MDPIFRLWHELTQSILKFIFHPDVKGKLELDFYSDFVRKFSRSIDQICHLKIVKECLRNVPADDAIVFLLNF